MSMDKCVCGILITTARPTIDLVISLVDSVVALLQALQAYLRLYNTNVEAQLIAAGLDLALDVAKAATDPVKQPLLAVTNLLNPYNDCDPIRAVQSAFSWVTDTIVGKTDALEYRIKQLKEQIDKDRKKIEWINQTINMLNTFTDTLQTKCN